MLVLFDVLDCYEYGGACNDDCGACEYPSEPYEYWVVYSLFVHVSFPILLPGLIIFTATTVPVQGPWCPRSSSQYAAVAPVSYCMRP